MNESELWYYSRFPEAAYPCVPKFKPEYKKRVMYGHNKMATSTVVITGLARDIADNMQCLIARITALGSMFKRYGVVLYENDSTDNTRQQLVKWADEDSHVQIIYEDLNKIRHEQNRTDDRTNDMAYYRNCYLDHIEACCDDSDYMIMVDTDIEGGWSYEGIANSFSYTWDGCGTNGILYENSHRIFFDSFAFRRLNHPTVHHSQEINQLVYNRGEPLIKVDSCFGGLMLYNRDSIQGIRYDGGDCEHAIFHKRMKATGHNSIYMNPSQIVLYNKSEYTL